MINSSVTHALIVEEKWANLILNGEKTLELRGKSTKKRERIGIIISKTKRIWGTVELVDCYLLDDQKFIEAIEKHQVSYPRSEVRYKQIYAWELKNPIRFMDPIEYKHKLGCVDWVNLE